MGILKMKREKDKEENEGEEDLLACKNSEEDGEGDSGACVDEFPVAKDTDEISGEGKDAETPAESSAASRDVS